MKGQETRTLLSLFNSPESFQKNYKKLHSKKERDKKGLFIVEGQKCIGECIHDFKPIALATNRNTTLPYHHKFPAFIESEEAYIQKISTLKTNYSCVAVFKMKPKQKTPSFSDVIPVFFSLNNPGNLGSIIRTSAWFGIKTILCTNDSVDYYNPKVVQGTMGSLGKVTVHYASVNEFLEKKKKENYAIVATVPEKGVVSLPKTEKNKTIILFGSESHGIPKRILENFVTLRYTIPKISNANAVESLNIGVAFGITIHKYLPFSL